MIDLLRDPVWQFIGATIAIVAIIVSLAVYFAQRRKKRLTYEILSRTPLLSMVEESAGKLQILFEGEIVRDVFLVVLKGYYSAKTELEWNMNCNTHLGAR